MLGVYGAGDVSEYVDVNVDVDGNGDVDGDVDKNKHNTHTQHKKKRQHDRCSVICLLYTHPPVHLYSHIHTRQHTNISPLYTSNLLNKKKKHTHTPHTTPHTIS